MREQSITGTSHEQSGSSAPLPSVLRLSPSDEAPALRPAGRLALLALSLWSALLSYLFFQVVLGGIPHVQDEINYVWQGRVFERLSLMAPLPPVEEVFSYGFQLRHAEGVFAIFPPGWPWVLAIAGWLKLSTLAPMLLGGIGIGLMFMFARQVLEVTAAEPAETGLSLSERRAIPWVTVVLAVLSPAYEVMAGTFMAHTLCLVLSLTFWISIHKVLSGGSAKAALLAGLSCGWLLATRPLDAVAAGALVLLWLLVRVVKRHVAWMRVPQLGAVAAVFLGALLLNNLWTTGSSLTFPQNKFFQTPPDGLKRHLFELRKQNSPKAEEFRFSATCNAPGLGADVGCSKTYGSFGHTPEKALNNAWYNLASFDRNLLGGAGAFVLVLPGIWILRRRWRWILPPMLLFPLLYGLYWFHGIAYGARFLHPMVPLALLCVAATLVRVSAWASSRVPALKPAWALGLQFAVLVAWSSSYISALMAEYGNDYWCVSPRLRDIAERFVKPGSLVLMGFTGEIPQHYWLSSLPGSVSHCNFVLRGGSGIALNDPWLENPVIFGYMPEKKEEVEQVQKAFSNRTVYFYIQDAKRGAEELLEVTQKGYETRFSAQMPPIPQE